VFAGRVRALLASLGEPVIESWLAGWPTDWPSRGTVSASPIPPRHTLAVLEWLPHAAQAAPAFSAELCALLADAAGGLSWQQTYSHADVASGAIETSFLDRYGWCEVIGPRAPIRSDRIACGFLLLGPQTCYPSHRHEAEELYLPLSGGAAWRQGDGDWQQRVPGTLIHHASFETHAMRTAAAPLLALYVWRGGNVQAKASFLPP
jgi:Dimethlysulfonioproprionate lyase